MSKSLYKTMDIKTDYRKRYNLSEHGLDMGVITLSTDESFIDEFMQHWTHTYDQLPKLTLSQQIERFVTYSEFIHFHKYDKAIHILTQFVDLPRFKIRFPPSIEGYLAFMSEIDPKLHSVFFRPLRAMIDEQSLARHTYVVGASGSGKSEVLKRLLNEILDNDSAIILIDPKGDLAEQVARFKDFSPNGKHHDRLVFFHATLFEKDGLYPVFNPFDQSDNVELASGELKNTLNVIFSEMSASRGGEFTLPMQTMIAPLINTMYRTRGDFFELLRFLGKDNEDLINIGKTSPNVMHSNYFTKDFAKTNELTKEGLKNRVGRLLESQLFQYLTTGESTIKLNDLIQQKKVIIIALKKGAMGTDQASYFGKLIASSIQINAQQRSELSKKDRIPTYLFIDEFQNYTTKAIKDVLAEARAYGLHLVLAQQIIGQDQDVNFQRVLMGNTHVKIMGTSTLENWKEMSGQMGLTIDELRKLPKFHYFVKVGGGKPFITSVSDSLVDNNYSMSNDEWQQVLEEQKKLYYTDSPSIVETKRLNAERSDYRHRNDGVETTNLPLPL